jgi:hypothetical protein
MNSNVQGPVDPKDPSIIAWNKYKESEDFNNCIKWNGEYCKGSLWTVFYAGYAMANGWESPK